MENSGVPGPDRLINWLLDHNASIQGIRPAVIPGSGLGLLAVHALEKGQIILSIPSSTLLTIDSPYLRKLRLPQKWTTHAKLAVTLTLWQDDPKSPLQEWRATLPKQTDLVESMPLVWPDGQHFLTPKAASHLEEQRKKLERDWNAAVSDAILADTSSTRKTFLYCWLLVNTRCFWWDYPALPKHSQKRRKLSQDPQECMALCPLMDLFNHSSQGCEVNFTKAGYTATCERDYAEGEQVCVSYGTFDNDFLLVDYGFILPHSHDPDIVSADAISLDHHILPRCTPHQLTLLKSTGYHSNYVLHSSSAPYVASSTSWQPCHRTEVALLLLSDSKESIWRAFVEGRAPQLQKGQREVVGQLLARVCEGLQEEAEDRLRSLKAFSSEDEGRKEENERVASTENIERGGEEKGIPPAAKKTLEMRWTQIRDVAARMVEDLRAS
ncbi:SET domain-containing protein [Viridothelium virens]|uniref:SET domain-containing protein n=1 Tax=Viridothelium virens TaxID=1048519 RepID=A0A6A6GT79_VIRVR|nr:SET domain-containing protein [Viridothelium virens]